MIAEVDFFYTTGKDPSVWFWSGTFVSLDNTLERFGTENNLFFK